MSFFGSLISGVDGLADIAGTGLDVYAELQGRKTDSRISQMQVENDLKQTNIAQQKQQEVTKRNELIRKTITGIAIAASALTVLALGGKFIKMLFGGR